MRHAARRRSSLCQSGFSLIELMVAITIAIFVLGGLAVLFINMKTTFSSQDQFAQLQDNERLASTILTTTVRSAGYFPSPATQTLAVALPASSPASASDFGSMAAEQSIVGTTGNADAPESLSVRYRTAANDTLMNCLGQTYTTINPPQQEQYNIFRIAPGSNVLSCSVDGGVSWNELVSGVSSMSVLYSVDRSPGNDRYLLQYLSASDVTAGSLWNRVTSAQITLQFINPLAGQMGNATFPWMITINLMVKS